MDFLLDDSQSIMQNSFHDPFPSFKVVLELILLAKATVVTVLDLNRSYRKSRLSKLSAQFLILEDSNRWKRAEVLAKEF